MGVDCLSIDGFECMSCHDARVCQVLIVGAGHPGEEDIGGLVLVSPYCDSEYCLGTS
jgi:hypothetical protein